MGIYSNVADTMNCSDEVSIEIKLASDAYPDLIPFAERKKERKFKTGEQDSIVENGKFLLLKIKLLQSESYDIFFSLWQSKTRKENLGTVSFEYHKILYSLIPFSVESDGTIVFEIISKIDTTLPEAELINLHVKKVFGISDLDKKSKVSLALPYFDNKILANKVDEIRAMLDDIALEDIMFINENYLKIDFKTDTLQKAFANLSDMLNIRINSSELSISDFTRLLVLTFSNGRKLYTTVNSTPEDLYLISFSAPRWDLILPSLPKEYNTQPKVISSDVFIHKRDRYKLILDCGDNKKLFDHLMRWSDLLKTLYYDNEIIYVKNFLNPMKLVFNDNKENSIYLIPIGKSNCSYSKYMVECAIDESGLMVVDINA